MVGWHQRPSGHGFEQTPRDGGGQKPGVLRTVGSQRVQHNSGTEQQHFLLFVCMESRFMHQIERVSGFIPAKVKCILQH